MTSGVNYAARVTSQNANYGPSGGLFGAIATFWCPSTTLILEGLKTAINCHACVGVTLSIGKEKDAIRRLIHFNPVLHDRLEKFVVEVHSSDSRIHNTLALFELYSIITPECITNNRVKICVVVFQLLTIICQEGVENSQFHTFPKFLATV